MPNENENAINFDQILQMLHWSKTKFFSRRQELLDAGVIFLQWEGKPPRRRIRAFPSRIKNWTGFKASKDEFL